MNLLQMSFWAGVLVLFIAIIRVVAINKLPKTMFLALWGIALCRFLIPLSLPSQISVNGFFSKLASKFLQNAQTTIDNRGVKNIIDNNGFTNLKEIGSSITSSGHSIETFILIWIAGMVFLAIFFTTVFWNSNREIRTALPVNNNSIIDKWLSEQKLRWSLRILVSDKITTPLSFGLLKSRIILPKSMNFSNDMHMRYILTHELIHLKRFDSFWKLLLIITLCLHWFNPMVWVLYVLMNRDLELTCDEKVINFFGESAKEVYALFLISMAESRSKFTPLYSGFSKNSTEERIVSIMKFKKKSVFVIVLALMLVIGATTVFAMNSEDMLHKLAADKRIDTTGMTDVQIKKALDEKNGIDSTGSPSGQNDLLHKLAANKGIDTTGMTDVQIKKALDEKNGIDSTGSPSGQNDLLHKLAADKGIDTTGMTDVQIKKALDEKNGLVIDKKP